MKIVNDFSEKSNNNDIINIRKEGSYHTFKHCNIIEYQKLTRSTVRKSKLIFYLEYFNEPYMSVFEKKGNPNLFSIYKWNITNEKNNSWWNFDTTKNDLVSYLKRELRLIDLINISKNKHVVEIFENYLEHSDWGDGLTENHKELFDYYFDYDLTIDEDYIESWLEQANANTHQNQEIISNKFSLDQTYSEVC